MKKIELPIKVGKISEWQKGLFIALLFSIIIFTLSVIVLFFKPVDKTVSGIIDEEISSTNITFDKKILEMLQTRQNPNISAPASAGKNPFAPF